MKTFLFALALTTVSFSAFADDVDARWGRRCTVKFQKCDFGFAGNCLRWNSKAFHIDRRDARWGCQMARERYDWIRRCDVDCRR
jgi:hypothetical protein